MSDSSNKLPRLERRREALNELDRALKSRERKAKAAPLGVVAATLAVLVLIVGGIYFAVTYTPKDDASTQAAASSDATIEQAALPSGPLEPYGASVTCDYPASTRDGSGPGARSVDAPAGADVPTSGTVEVTLDTNEGPIPLTLDRSTSPCTVNSFAHLVQKKYYDDTICHRAVKSPTMTILQCGDPTGSGAGGPGYSYADEFPKNGVSAEEQQSPMTYPRGTLAMANAGPDTNGSQFFLVSQDTTLPPLYNVFGTISEEGLATLDAIAEKNPDGDQAPAEEVRITSATVK